MNKQKTWQEAKRKTRKIVDKLAMPIDKDIVETVTVLRLLGFNTTASCGGHMRRTTGGPYVILESPEANKYAKLAREINNSKDKKFQMLRKKANRFRVFDLQRLSEHLENFYRDRQTNYNDRIIIQSMPMAMNILKCHGAEIALVSTGGAKKEIVENNRAEMTAFTEYLKTQYFTD